VIARRCDRVNTTHLFNRLIVIPFLLAAAPALGGCSAQGGLAKGASSADLHTVTVVGHGEVHAKPDVARANLGVEVTAPTVEEATKLSSARMTSLLDALKRAGVAEKDIRTSNFSINFERYDSGGPMPLPEIGTPPAPTPTLAPAPPVAPPKPVGGPKHAPASASASAPASAPVALAPPPRARTGFYRVTNTVDVTIHDMSKIGPVLDTAVAAGANNVWGINFALDNTDALGAQAREKAVADARSRAEALAKLQGLMLGPVVSVSEVVGERSGPVRPMMMTFSAAASDGVPVSSGELSYSSQIEVVYSLGDSTAKE
jgi:uncharacterized protein